MPLSDLTEPEAVLQAIAEFDSLGRDAFLTKYGFGAARRYFLDYEGQKYDTKAIVGAAHGFQLPNLGPLKAADFSGGDATVRRKLEELGFVVEVTDLLINWRQFCQELQAEHPEFQDWRIETNYLRAPEINYTHISLVYGRRQIAIQLVLQGNRIEEADALEEKLVQRCRSIDPSVAIEKTNTDLRVRMRLGQGIGDASEYDKNEAKDWYLKWRDIFEPFWREEVNPHSPDDPKRIQAKRAKSISQRDHLTALIEKQLAEDELEPSSIEDARERNFRSIVQRRGQAGFRKDLLAAYQGRCAVTDCDVPAVLEAAHIHPYQGEATNVISNGLLLRADIHTLFDQGLIAFSPTDFKVILSDELKGSGYEGLGKTHLNVPDDDVLRPNPKLLRWHCENWGLE